MRRVVVTGMGIWSCIGKNKEEVAESLKNGKSGIGIDPMRKEYGFHSPLTGIVEKPDLKPLLHRRLRACLSEEAEYAYMASREAFLQAKIDDEYLLANEVGVIFGNDSTAEATVQVHETMVKEKDSAMVGSGLLFQSMNSTVNMNLSTIFHLRGINFTISAACASGSHSIGLGYMFIKQGLQDVILVGGAQETNKYSMAAFDALGTFSSNIENPQLASRPFDEARDGLIPSGGAAALVLEDYDHAIARGATILAEIIGYGFSSNGAAISQPSDQGSFVAMQRALNDAKISAIDIDYVNAHATSTPQGDEMEAKALSALFTNQKTWISSTKSMTGHECWMAGASEAVYSILMMKNNFIAPNININNICEAAAPLKIAKETIYTPLNYILSNSFGFGGTNSAIVLKNINN